MYDEQFAVQFAANLAAAADFLGGKDRECIKAKIFEMLRFGVVCTKHPGFAELEWRVVYSLSAVESKPAS
jgi:hypothetical protein